MCSFHFCCYFQGLLKKDLFSNLSKTLISPLVSKLGCACHLTFFLLQFSSWCVCIKLQNYKWLLLCLCKRTILKETSRKVCIKDRKPSLFIHSIFPGWWSTCHGTLLLYLLFAFFFFFSFPDHFYPFLSCFSRRSTGIPSQSATDCNSMVW